MTAIIETGGKQYKVSEGDEILIEKLAADAGTSYVFDKVLCVFDDSKTIVGKPVIEGASVTAEVLGNIKGKKLVVYKYKSKKGFHKKKGHRQPYTRVKISSVSA